jgi:hypothetical protein
MGAVVPSVIPHRKPRRKLFFNPGLMLKLAASTGDRTLPVKHSRYDNRPLAQPLRRSRDTEDFSDSASECSCANGDGSGEKD